MADQLTTSKCYRQGPSCDPRAQDGRNGGFVYQYEEDLMIEEMVEKIWK